MKDDDIKSSLLYILTNAGNAHQVYEEHVLSGKRDEDWANWYAEYLIQNGINNILDSDLTKSEVETLLRDAADEQKKTKAKIGWAPYYNDFIIRHVIGSVD